MSVAACVDVRRARPADAVQLAEVHTQCWQQTYPGLMSDAFLAALKPADRLPMWCQLLLAPEPAAWVACVDGSVVGFSATRTVPQGDTDQDLPTSGSLELWGLYLIKSHQGLGLGRRLLEAALGAGPASLWVAAGNGKAIGFYERLRFAPDGAEDRVADWEDLHEIRMIRSR
ncbi:GNAT family N-acetyltransferase [Pseudarthrobacter sp. NBSH8]|nr:GNAT family N-acetyltransferase [Pseudarthrobacter sp. NBSH8]